MNGEQIGIGNLTKLGHPDGWNRESILGFFRMIEGKRISGNDLRGGKQSLVIPDICYRESILKFFR